MANSSEKDVSKSPTNARRDPSAVTINTVNEWLTHRLYHGDSAIYLCVTENGSIGVFDSPDESAKAIGGADEAIEALFDAVRRDAPWLVDHLNGNCCADCHRDD